MEEDEETDFLVKLGLIICLQKSSLAHALSSLCRSHFSFTCLGVLCLLLAHASCAVAYDPLDPHANITIVWDILSWNQALNGYQAGVSLHNYQQYRHIELPGWILGWEWAGQEIIWTMSGAEATMQGDCSRVQQGDPHSCDPTPTIVDVLPSQYNTTNPVANCCKGGVLPSWGQDPANAVASFQLTTGSSGSTIQTVRMPRNFTLRTPGPGYSCGPTRRAPPSLIPATQGRRQTQAFVTWTSTCIYSQFIGQSAPRCCVSLSAFFNDQIVNCPTCACACQGNNDSCVQSAPPQIVDSSTPLVYCTQDMCPVRIHWHVKQNYESYWRVKLTVINRNYAHSYSQWTVVAQHPNFSNITKVYSFDYTTLTPYDTPSDAAMFWGIQYYNDRLMEAGPEGNVQTEILFQKDPKSFSLRDGWPYPHRIYFNGDFCQLPPADSFPTVPNGKASSLKVDGSLAVFVIATALTLFLLC